MIFALLISFHIGSKMVSVLLSLEKNKPDDVSLHQINQGVEKAS
jgi:hypothetical protein